MENNVGKKAYYFEKLIGGINLNGELCTDEISLVLSICDVIGYKSETKEYVVRTQFLDKNINHRSVFFNKDELKDFFSSFFLKNNILDFNNGETCYLCDEIYTQMDPVKRLCISLTKAESSNVASVAKHNMYYDIFYNTNQIHNTVSSFLNDGILDELTFED